MPTSSVTMAAMLVIRVLIRIYETEKSVDKQEVASTREETAEQTSHLLCLLQVLLRHLRHPGGHRLRASSWGRLPVLHLRHGDRKWISERASTPGEGVADRPSPTCSGLDCLLKP